MMMPRESALFSRGCKPHISGGRPMSGHGEGVCTSGTTGCALVRGSSREIRWGEGVQKLLIFMHFHGVFPGNQHEIWSKPHNGKVSFQQVQLGNKGEDPGELLFCKRSRGKPLKNQ